MHMTNMTHGESKDKQMPAAQATQNDLDQEHMSAKRSWLHRSRARLATRPWWEVADLLASDIRFTTQLCTTLTLPIAEIKALWLLHLETFEIFKTLHEAWHSEPPLANRMASGSTSVKLDPG